VQELFLVEELESVILEPAHSRRVEVIFSPANDQRVGANLLVASDDPDTREVRVALSGLGISGVLAVRPQAIDFGTAVVGSLQRREIVLTNTGLAGLEGAIVPVGFTRPEQFSLAPLEDLIGRGAYSVSARGEMVIDLDYHPGEVGSDRGRILFEMCGAACGLEVEVVGEASQAVVQLVPPRIDFGAQAIGVTRTEQLMVNNSGTEAVNLTRVEAVGGPEIELHVSESLPASLGASSSLWINVEYTPQSAILFRGSVVVETDDPSVPEVVAEVVGEGQGPLFLVQPENIAFGVQRPGMQARARPLAQVPGRSPGPWWAKPRGGRKNRPSARYARR